MLSIEPYLAARDRWPAAGRHILATYDAERVVVYQAFRAPIADEAVRLGRFGASFALGRMSWIKPNFLWMMFRSGWATKESQERILAVALRREFFDRVLRSAVASSYDRHRFASREDWTDAVQRSDVRLQWDPDHDPSGTPIERRALQLGLRGPVLAEYAGPAILALEDITELVHEARPHASAPYTELRVPAESVYVPDDPSAIAALGLGSRAE